MEYVKEIAEKQGYCFNVEKGSLGSRNIVIGDPEKAKVLFTAHYDTCAVLPFPNFITPKNFLIYLLYQIAIVIPVLLADGIVGFAFGLLGAHYPSLPVGELAFISTYVILFGFLILIAAGPSNKHTANDNTSGVTLLLDIMASLPEASRDKVSFVFFDLEEAGLIGSSSYASKHKDQAKNKLLINFDCVSDGKHILFALNKNADGFADLLKECYPSDENFTVEVVQKGVFYPSDQAVFKKGIGVAALKKAKRTGVLYMDRIHTKKDTVYQEENIEFLKNGSVRLAEKIA